MPKPGDEIVNPRTGQRMIFLKTAQETTGQLLRIETFNPLGYRAKYPVSNAEKAATPGAA